MELLLKASFALTVAFLFYKLLLQQESFFTVNRFYLVGCLALAFALPFVSLPKLISHQGYLTTVLQTFERPESSIIKHGQKMPEPAPQNVTAPSKTKVMAPSPKPQAVASPIVVAESPKVGAEAPVATRSWLFWVAGLYWFGVVIFTLSLLFQVATVIFKILTATDKIADGEVVLVNTASRQAPCSFFKYVFIYPNDYDFETYEQIIAHEKIHARLGHSFDLLLAEVVVIVLWFNPLSWFFKREIEKNNEYQTDAMLLQKERVSPQQYQLNLVQIAVPNKPLSITTNYNQSLLKQRIMMMNAKKSTPHAYWKYSFLAPLFFGTLLMLNEPATSQELPASTISLAIKTNPAPAVIKKKVTEKVAVKVAVKSTVKVKNNKPITRQQTTNIRYGDVDMSSGFWYGHQEAKAYCIEFKGGQSRSNWNMTQCFDKSRFQKKANDVFVLTGEAGTLQLTGNLEAEVSQGKYTFTEDAAFKKYLADNNLLSRDKNLLVHLFFGNVNRAYVDFLKKNYATVNGERLLEVAIHDISLADHQSYITLFQKYNNKRPSLPEVVEAKIHDVDENYAQELNKMGFQGLSMKKIIEAKIHDVNAPFLAGLKQAGYNDLPIDKVIEAKIHDVDPDFLTSLKQAGFANLPLNKVVEARIHDINPATAKELRALGFGELGLDKMIELQIHEVNANYIKDLQGVGLKNLTLDQVLEAKIHDLDPASVKAIQALGFTNLDFRELMDAQIHEVDAPFLAELRDAGFKNLTLDKTVEAKIHDIDGKFIKQARQKGYNFNSIDKYISLKIHGMAIESLKEDKEK